MSANDAPGQLEQGTGDLTEGAAGRSPLSFAVACRAGDDLRKGPTLHPCRQP